VQRLDRYTRKPPTNIWRCISGDHYVGLRHEPRELETLGTSLRETRPRLAYGVRDELTGSLF
jgi:hypothetical protein